MTIPASPTGGASPYGALPMVQVFGPDGGPYEVRRPVPVVLLPSVSRTASTTSAIQVPQGYRGVLLWLSVSVNPGGAQTLALTLFAAHPVTADAQPLLTVPASAAPGGAFLLYPGASGAAVEGISLTRNLYLNGRWYVAVTNSGIGAWTYRVDAELLP